MTRTAAIMADGHEPDRAEAIQRRIRQAREQLLGGRGPGASQLETARWMRERPRLGGQPAAACREAVAERAVIARGDFDGFRQVAVQRGARLSVTIAEISSRLARVRQRARLGTMAALGGMGIALAARAVTRRRRPGPRRGH